MDFHNQESRNKATIISRVCLPFYSVDQVSPDNPDTNKSPSALNIPVSLPSGFDMKVNDGNKDLVNFITISKGHSRRRYAPI